MNGSLDGRHRHIIAGGIEGSYSHMEKESFMQFFRGRAVVHTEGSLAMKETSYKCGDVKENFLG